MNRFVVQRYHQEYSQLLYKFQHCFKGVTPPEPTWWLMWLKKYGYDAIFDVISKISRAYPTRAWTTEGIGKYISATLRDEALVEAFKETEGLEFPTAAAPATQGGADDSQN